jgi:hypothetical protein
MFLSQKIGNQRVHSRSCKKDCRVVFGQQGFALDLGVSFGDEKINVLVTEFISSHAGILAYKEGERQLVTGNRVVR